MVDYEDFWRKSGLVKGQIVEFVVVSHRSRYGIDVEITSHPGKQMAFIDFLLIGEEWVQMPPDKFPKVGTVGNAVVVDLYPGGELRLTSRPSLVAKRRKELGEGLV